MGIFRQFAMAHLQHAFIISDHERGNEDMAGPLVRTAMTILALLVLSMSGAAHAARRVALVIGNSSYRHVAALPNPANDARAIAEIFQQAKFDAVITKVDAGIAELRQAVRAFNGLARRADIAVVYYAGHGIEVDGTNYLIPTDAKLASDFDVEDEAFSVDRVLRAIEPARKLRLIILDACRDNPFARSMKRTIASRAIGRGLARVEPATVNTLIAYAAEAGSVASDGDGVHSPFTTALLRHLVEPGLDLRFAFGKVRDDVIAQTHGAQTPFVYGSLGGEQIALAPAIARPVVAPPPRPVAPAADPRRDFEVTSRIGTRAAFESYLAVYKTGLYAELARAQLAKIVAAEQMARTAALGAEPRPTVIPAARPKAAVSTKPASPPAAAPASASAASTDVSTEIAPKPSVPANIEQKLQMAVLAAPSAPAKPPAPVALAPADLARLIKVHLAQVGCDPGAINGEWDAKGRQALARFNHHAGTRLDTKTASLAALTAIKSRDGRVCPLSCARGFRADGEHCVRATCRRGYVLDEDGDCVREERAALSPQHAPRRSERTARTHPTTRQAQTRSSGAQVLCNRFGCKSLAKNCRIKHVPGAVGGATSGGQISTGGQVVVCD